MMKQLTSHFFSFMVEKPAVLFLVLELLFLVWFSGNGLLQNIPVEVSLWRGSSTELLVFVGVWLFFSLLFHKFTSINKTFLIGLRNLFLANVCTFWVVQLICHYHGIQLFAPGQLREVGFWLTIGEGVLLFIFLNVSSWLSQVAIPEQDTIRVYLTETGAKVHLPAQEVQDTNSEQFRKYQNLVSAYYGPRFFNYLANHFNFSQEHNVVLNVRKGGEVLKASGANRQRILSLQLVNNFPRINKYFEAVNSCLVEGGIFICAFRPQQSVEKKIFRKWPPLISSFVYCCHFVFRRVFPKLKGTKGLYFYLTRGRNRSISRVEVLGRLYSCGFKYLEGFKEGEFLFFVVVKKKEPAFDMHPSYGPVFKMRRIGKDGREICVYKLRTMYPYSEYLQEYIYERHQLGEGGKINNDIRITPLGRILRKCWLDELPNLLNLFKGQIKLIGVRPISRHYLSLYSKELQELRTKVKPGLIPPFYADLPKTLEEIQLSEKRYIEAYLKRPFRTDIKYFVAALQNVVCRGTLSK